MHAKILRVLPDAMRSSHLGDALAAFFDATVGSHGYPPLVTGLLSLARTAGTIRDAIYARKVMMFLSPIDEVDEAARDEFFGTLEADEQQWHRFQVTVFTLIDRCDDVEKSLIMGRMMKAVLQKDLALDTAVRICHMINKSYVSDLYCLKEAPVTGIWLTTDQKGALKETYVTSNLQSTGFIRFAGIYGGTLSKDDGCIMYETDKLGHILLKYGLSDEINCWNKFWTD